MGGTEEGKKREWGEKGMEEREVARLRRVIVE